jgi:hypothetical protein
MFCGLFSKPSGAVYLIKKRTMNDVYSIEYHNDDSFAVPVDAIIAKTNPVPEDMYGKIAMRLRGRGYDVPFIHTKDLNMLVGDFWAAVAVAEGTHKKW